MSIPKVWEPGLDYIALRISVNFWVNFGEVDNIGS